MDTDVSDKGPHPAPKSRTASGREGRLEAVQQGEGPDVLIVGGGINGVGLFRDLALQGVKVVLVEKGDFCSGSSAAPSRMIHGGLRYLEYGETKLVRESLHERDAMMRNAPHYVRPIETVVPLYSWFKGLFSAVPKFFRGKGRASQRGAVVVMLGLTFYDIFTRSSRMVPKRSFARRPTTLASLPVLDESVVGSATYWDGQISHPERLALELALDGEASSEDATALNYVSFVGMDDDTVSVRDELTGEEATMRPRVLVNATGGWIDLTNATMGAQTRSVEGVKGSHLVLDDPELLEMLGERMVYFQNSDQRICIVIPWRGKVLAGSTEIPVADPDTAVCTPEETRYILASINELFPGRTVTEEAVISTFSGVRPLVATDRETENEMSRDHSLGRVEPPTSDVPVYSMAGGKWTTFRSFSEQVADLALDDLGLERSVSTKELAIGGGRDYPQDESARTELCGRLAAETGLSQERVGQLLERYGTTAAEIAASVAKQGDEKLESCPDYSVPEMEWIIEHEHVRRLDDLILRRTDLALLGGASMPLLQELSVLLATGIGLSPSEQEAQVATTVAVLHDHFSINLKEDETSAVEPAPEPLEVPAPEPTVPVVG